MKEVYVLRHAHWDGKEDILTDQGRDAAKVRSAELPSFAVVYSSPFIRTQQTAELLGRGARPQIEAAASVPQTPPKVRQRVLERRSTHPLGIAGALFETTEAHPALRVAGGALKRLIQQALDELHEEQKALIVSHDGTIAAAERMLTNKDFAEPLQDAFGEMEGFVVNENLWPRRLEDGS